MHQWIKYVVINTESGLLRSGWRALVFLTILVLPPRLLMATGGSGAPDAPNKAISTYEVGISQVAYYLPMVTWILIVSWFCLVFLERKRLGALGLEFSRGWWQDFQQGLLMSTLMVGSIFLAQVLFGASRPALNSWWSSGGVVGPLLRHSMVETTWSLLLLTLAALFEELLYRGYAFQTLLRGSHPAVPISILSVLFGLSHLGNPNSTLLSTANTILAGLWLAAAYLKSRNLWFPTGLHLGWNVLLGPVFGLPVSGRLIQSHPLILTSSGEPLWLSGGGYGSEGGAGATAVLTIAILIIVWRRNATANKSTAPDN